MGHIFVATDLYTVGSFDPDHDAVMRIGGEAQGGGPILSVGISAMFEYGVPPPRIVNSGQSAESQRERRVCSYGRSACRTQDDALQCLASGDKAPERDDQFASRATIMVLRVPIRLSAVRARYHRASALSF